MLYLQFACAAMFEMPAIAQQAHPCCLNVYKQLQDPAALLKPTALLNIHCISSDIKQLKYRAFNAIIKC